MHGLAQADQLCWPQEQVGEEVNCYPAAGGRGNRRDADLPPAFRSLGCWLLASIKSGGSILGLTTSRIVYAINHKTTPICQSQVPASCLTPLESSSTSVAWTYLAARTYRCVNRKTLRHARQLNGSWGAKSQQAVTATAHSKQQSSVPPPAALSAVPIRAATRLFTTIAAAASSPDAHCLPGGFPDQAQDQFCTP